MTLKRVLAVLSAVLILALSIIPSFAEEPELAPETTNVILTDYEFIDATDTDYYSYIDSGELRIDYKNFTGALRYQKRALNEPVIRPYSITMYGNVALNTNTDGNEHRPRLNVGLMPGKKVEAHDGLGSITGSLGWSFAIDTSNSTLRIFRCVGLNNSTYYQDLPWEYVIDVGDNTAVEYCMEAINGRLALYLRYNTRTGSEQSDEYVFIDSYHYDTETAGTQIRPTYQIYDRVVTSEYSSFIDYTASFKTHIVTYRYYRTDEAYDLGYREGRDKGLEEGYLKGYDEGDEDGYDRGLREGLINGARREGFVIDIPNIISTYMQSTIGFFHDVFSFELFGINISALIGALTVVIVVAWIVRKLVK